MTSRLAGEMPAPKSRNWSWQPLDDEADVLERMHHEFTPAQGLRLRNTHHEVYFSDVRCTAPERMRTLLRQSVTPT